MRLFRRKKNYSIDELNKINQEQWEKQDPSEKESKQKKSKQHEEIVNNLDMKISTTKTKNNIGEINDSFAIKQFDFNEGMESVIEVSYGAPRESKVKLFFSTNDFTTFSRNYTEKLTDNFVKLTIAVATRVNVSWNTGGNYDINSSDGPGYTLTVSLRHQDSQLLAVISNVLRSENFGPLPPSRFTISAHRNDNFPTEHEAVEILDKLNYKIAKAVLEMKD